MRTRTLANGYRRPPATLRLARRPSEAGASSPPEAPQEQPEVLAVGPAEVRALREPAAAQRPAAQEAVPAEEQPRRVVAAAGRAEARAHPEAAVGLRPAARAVVPVERQALEAQARQCLGAAALVGRPALGQG